MTTYQYEPLDSEGAETRLLTIQPGATTDEIRISSLHGHPLGVNSSDCYEVLSYAWGSTEEPGQVVVESPTGKDVISVTQNLVFALRHLRLRDEPRVM
ncbi:hypothetical protein BJ170DRAFT_122008 [Xylariales sp. AK1849]|nr:hypothetical protein BJ170DRAFT_122008 [Xylariales sp. AK1849]